MMGSDVRGEIIYMVPQDSYASCVSYSCLSWIVAVGISLLM